MPETTHSKAIIKAIKEIDWNNSDAIDRLALIATSPDPRTAIDVSRDPFLAKQADLALESTIPGNTELPDEELAAVKTAAQEKVLEVLQLRMSTFIKEQNTENFRHQLDRLNHIKSSNSLEELNRKANFGSDELKLFNALSPTQKQDTGILNSLKKTVEDRAFFLLNESLLHLVEQQFDNGVVGWFTNQNIKKIIELHAAGHSLKHDMSIFAGVDQRIQNLFQFIPDDKKASDDFIAKLKATALKRLLHSIKNVDPKLSDYSVNDLAKIIAAKTFVEAKENFNIDDPELKALFDVIDTSTEISDDFKKEAIQLFVGKKIEGIPQTSRSERKKFLEALKHFSESRTIGELRGKNLNPFMTDEQRDLYIASADPNFKAKIQHAAVIRCLSLIAEEKDTHLLKQLGEYEDNELPRFYEDVQEGRSIENVAIKNVLDLIDIHALAEPQQKGIMEELKRAATKRSKKLATLKMYEIKVSQRGGQTLENRKGDIVAILAANDHPLTAANLYRACQAEFSRLGFTEDDVLSLGNDEADIQDFKTNLQARLLVLEIDNAEPLQKLGFSDPENRFVTALHKPDLQKKINVYAAVEWLKTFVNTQNFSEYQALLHGGDPANTLITKMKGLVEARLMTNHLPALFDDDASKKELLAALQKHVDDLHAKKETGLGAAYRHIAHDYQKPMYFGGTYKEHARQVSELADIGTPLPKLAKLVQTMNRNLAFHQSQQRFGELVAPGLAADEPAFGEINRSSLYKIKADQVSQYLFDDDVLVEALVAAYDMSQDKLDSIEGILAKLSRSLDPQEIETLLQELDTQIGVETPKCNTVEVKDGIYYQNLSKRIYGHVEGAQFLRAAQNESRDEFLGAIHPFVFDRKAPIPDEGNSNPSPALNLNVEQFIADISLKLHESFLTKDDAKTSLQDVNALGTGGVTAPAIADPAILARVRREAAIRYLGNVPTKAEIKWLGTGSSGRKRDAARERNEAIEESVNAALACLSEDLDSLKQPKLDKYLKEETLTKYTSQLDDIEQEWDELLPALMANRTQAQKRLNGLEAELEKRSAMSIALSKQKVALEERSKALENHIANLRATEGDNFTLPKALSDYKVKLDDALNTCRRRFEQLDHLYQRLQRLHLKITQHDSGATLKSKRWSSKRVSRSELASTLKKAGLEPAAQAAVQVGNAREEWGASSELLQDSEVMLHEKTVEIDDNSYLDVKRITEPNGTMRLYATARNPNAATPAEKAKPASLYKAKDKTEMMKMSLDMMVEFIEQNGLPSKENPMALTGADQEGRIACYVALKHLFQKDKVFSKFEKHIYMPGISKEEIKQGEKAFSQYLDKTQTPELERRQREMNAIAEMDKSLLKNSKMEERKEKLSQIRQDLGISSDEQDALQRPSRLSGPGGK